MDDIRSIDQIEPGRCYPSPVVARLFGISLESVHRWATTGRLKALPRPGGRGPLRFEGVEILLTWGREPRPAVRSETMRERLAREGRAMDEIRRLAKVPQGRERSLT